MTSIYDIAKKTGVSATTVSRVLNNKSASAETRNKVLREVKRAGYIPDARASSLKSRQNKSIGLIIPDISNPVYPLAVKIIHDVARERGFHLILGNTYGRVAEEQEILEMMARERVSGLILSTCEGDNDALCTSCLQRMVKAGVFLVLTEKRGKGLKADEICIDNFKGVYKAVNYLLRIGRKRIAFISGMLEPLVAERRLKGYLQSLREKGISQDRKIISFGDWTRESGMKQMENILRTEDNIDAVFCSNDLLAIGAMESIEKSGLKIPEDIAVVGFDDIEFASLIKPKLTTVRQPLEKTASMACNLLMDRIEGEKNGEPKEIWIEPELIVRESA